LKMWNYKFKLTYTVTLSDSSMKTTLHVDNRGVKTFSFTCLLHTYLKVGDVSTATVSNLCGLTYSDKARGGEEFVEDRDVVVVDKFVDSTYSGTPNELKITGVTQTGKKTVIMKKENLPDTVIWNPWKEKAAQMSDLDTHVSMLCVEPGHVSSPVDLTPGQHFHASQTLTVLDS